MTTIRALLIDLGNVIVGLDFDRAYQAAERVSPYSAGEIPGRIRATGLADRYERGEISSAAFYREFCGALEMDVSFEQFQALWGNMFHSEPLLSEPFLRALAGKQRMLVLSNTNEIHFQFIQAHFPHLAYFDDYVLSYQVGVMKPEEAIYQEAIRRAGCEPSQCFFTDDNEANVSAARRAGIDAVVFGGERDLMRQLRRRGIAWE